MAGLVKELLLDYGLNRLSLDLRSDLTIAIQTVLSSAVFTPEDAIYLDMYLSGYTSKEIADRYIKEAYEIEAALERIFTAIETYSGYTDTSFIYKLEMTHKYRKRGIQELTQFLSLHSKSYATHELSA